MIKWYKIKFKSINVWIHSLDSCSGDIVENHLISGTWSCFPVFNGVRSLGLSHTLYQSPYYKITHHKNFYWSPYWFDSQQHYIGITPMFACFAAALHRHYNNACIIIHSSSLRTLVSHAHSHARSSRKWYYNWKLSFFFASNWNWPSLWDGATASSSLSTWK